MEHSDWDDDGGYPPAPLPPHERRWRHPSEVGSDAWVRTEPPLAIGRGLGAATGVVGVALTAAVMWAMLSTGAGRGPGVAARSTVAATGLVAGARTPTTVEVVAPSTTTTVATAFASTGRPAPTYRVEHQTVIDPAAGSTPAQAAVAVAVHDGRLVLTTARAVHDDAVALRTADGTPSTATVLLVDEQSGLAVLAPESSVAADAYSLAADVAAGDTVTVLADAGTDVVVEPDGLPGTSCGAPEDVPEGSPVVTTDGTLVALCTHTEGGTRMVGLGNLDELRRALGGALAPTVWMGVVLNDDPAGELVVGALEPDGPAALAGLDIGDTIVAVDGEPVTDLEELAGILALHRPGDLLPVVVACPDGTAIEVLVELAAPKAAV